MIIKRKKIIVQGIVQGLGFRPAIVRKADLLNLTGTVLNTRDSLEIEIEGTESSVDIFINEFYNFIPVNAVVNSFVYEEMTPAGKEKSFLIVESRDYGPSCLSIPPDIAMCEDCRKEFNDLQNRRYKYPFITCGVCGPRYTYMENMPYDRGNTSMKHFPLCADCMKEYNDPLNRRFHIEGFSCPICGPFVKGLDKAIEALRNNSIVAAKGLGGYNIICSAINDEAVVKLRKRKNRPSKPFAVMFPSVEKAKEYVNMSLSEEALLRSRVSPIVICEAKEDRDISSAVAPFNAFLGVMIPYTPLHELILEKAAIPLVMTSANISGDPLIIDDSEAIKELSDVVDSFIIHNRAILKRADDSISFFHRDMEMTLRMGRGRIPFPIKIDNPQNLEIMAFGAELKNNITIVSGSNLVTGNHVGDLSSPETFNHFIKTADEMIEYYSLNPDIVICDKHPDYESTTFAEDFAKKTGARLMQVQHHYAHFLSCYFENRLEGEALGIIFDGTGYGDDGTIWGGEIFAGDLHSFTRCGHIKVFPLPGGEKAISEPWRILAGFFDPDDFIEICSFMDSSALENIYKISGKKEFSPLTSSAGRLFDAVSALLGFNRNVTFEAEGAIYLEQRARKTNVKDTINIPFEKKDGVYIADPIPFMRELYFMKKSGRDIDSLAAIFHNSLCLVAAEIAMLICKERNIKNVMLSGGVFQNRIMLEILEKRLVFYGLNVFFNKSIPVNDAGISTGQAVYGVYNA